jgi:cob(I)alamin adenosyltransferase
VSKIYTKKGDKGETSTCLGKMGKNSDLAEALGSLDEVNSIIGVCRIQTKDKKIDAELKRIQNNLMIITTQVAGSKLKIRNGEAEHLEKLIDELSKELPILNNFIYPTGYLQMARAVARRAERDVVALNNQLPNTKIQTDILEYLNRLSDALFVMGRRVNFKNGITEETCKV